MMNGARGLSVLFASGDQGVWGRTGHSETIPGFHPDFPAGSPYITAVGGTQFATTSVLGDETTWADGGGGFSDTFAAPDYQLDAVKSYFSSGVDLPPSSDYNATGRGYRHSSLALQKQPPPQAATSSSSPSSDHQ